MKTTRKISSLLSILLIGALLLGLSACGASTGESTDGDKKVLRVAMECGYAPYNWSQENKTDKTVKIKNASGYAFGYDVMIAKYVAEKMGYTVEIHQIDWDSLPTAVQSGSVDCVIAGQSITAERLQTVDFTTPYYYASVVSLVRKDSKYASAKGLSELKGASATSQLNTIWYDKALPQIPSVKALTAMETVPTMLAALNAGTVDVVVTDIPTAKAALMAYDTLALLDFTDTEDDYKVSEEDVNIGISLKKGNTELKDALNAALATLTVEDFDRMMEEAIAAQPLAQE